MHRILLMALLLLHSRGVHQALLACHAYTAAGKRMAHSRTPEDDFRQVRLPAERRARRGETPCTNGVAGAYPCDSVDLLSYLPLDELGGGHGNDLWGWTDPLTGREVVLMGRSTGVSYVDVSDPVQPVLIGTLPPHLGIPSMWRDIKTYGNFAVVVSESEDHGLQVFDLTRLRGVALPPVTFSASAHYDGFGSAHNVVVNEATGYAYAVGSETCQGGLHMIDLENPLQPTFAGCYAADGYTHDAQCVLYSGPDTEHHGKELCFCSNEDTLTIVDVTDKTDPRELSRTGYQGVGYTHQGWLTPDQTYFLGDDELDEQNLGARTRTFVWDLSDLDSPDVIGVHQSTSTAIDHNQYITRGHVFQANYRSGLRILETDRVASGELEPVAFFDIYPADDAPFFNGAWSVYPFFDSGVVALSGIEQGLFLLRPRLASSPVDFGGDGSSDPTTYRDGSWFVW